MAALIYVVLHCNAKAQYVLDISTGYLWVPTLNIESRDTTQSYWGLDTHGLWQTSFMLPRCYTCEKVNNLDKVNDLSLSNLHKLIIFQWILTSIFWEKIRWYLETALKTFLGAHIVKWPVTNALICRSDLGWQASDSTYRQAQDTGHVKYEKRLSHDTVSGSLYHMDHADCQPLFGLGFWKLIRPETRT